MWDTKRKAIWLSIALLGATFFAYLNARDESEGFDIRYFALVEVVFVVVVVVMFYFYSRKKS